MKTFGKTVRVEDGPKRVEGVTATAALLSDDVTATHYQAGGVDADGAEIKVGQPMTYLDWKGDRVFYVYQLQDVEVPTEDGKSTETVEKFVEVAVFDTEEKAVAKAEKLAR